MPYFDFSAQFTTIKAKQAKKPKSVLTVIDKNVIAVVDIDKDLNYLAVFEDGRTYNIAPACYKCKNHQVIYSQLLIGEHKQRLIIHRALDCYYEHFPYLPFAVGCLIKGNIVKNNLTNTRYFIIKKCYVDNNNRFAFLITKAFRDIYDDELEQRIINKYTNDRCK